MNSDRFGSRNMFCSYLCDKVIELTFPHMVKEIECPVCFETKTCLYTECPNKHALCFECQVKVG